MSATKYAIGLDYGTNSVRTLIVNIANGREVASAVWEYEHGTQGVILSRDPNLARQNPADYVTGAEITIKKQLEQLVQLNGNQPYAYSRDALVALLDAAIAESRSAK